RERSQVRVRAAASEWIRLVRTISAHVYANGRELAAAQEPDQALEIHERRGAFASDARAPTVRHSTSFQPHNRALHLGEIVGTKRRSKRIGEPALKTTDKRFDIRGFASVVGDERGLPAGRRHSRRSSIEQKCSFQLGANPGAPAARSTSPRFPSSSKYSAK